MPNEVPIMPTHTWNSIKNLDPVPHKPDETEWGYWIVGEMLHTLVVSAQNTWEFVAKDTDPPPPPTSRGRMDHKNWRNIKGGVLQEMTNSIYSHGKHWRVVFQPGEEEEEPGEAVPVKL